MDTIHITQYTLVFGLDRDCNRISKSPFPDQAGKISCISGFRFKTKTLFILMPFVLCRSWLDVQCTAYQSKTSRSTKPFCSFVKLLFSLISLKKSLDVLQGNLNVSLTMNVIKGVVQMVSNLINPAKSQGLPPPTIYVTHKRRIMYHYVCKGLSFQKKRSLSLFAIEIKKS